ncbi:MAG: prolipoprotein diacylglyceryl transferase [Firmicutes bacterium]|nr:prolipoprotein diacylglyceryl transferase [Bacillota bacterium]
MPYAIGLAVVLLGIFLYFWLRPIFAGKWVPSPIAFQIGNLTVRWYGLLIGLSIIPGWFLAEAAGKRAGLNPDALFNVLIMALPAGIIGARLGFVIQNLAYFTQHPGEIMALWTGGLSIHGGLVLGLGVVVAYALITKTNFFRITDVVMPSILLGQAIGRWGNFFNEELYGYPTDLPWKMYIAPEHRLPGFEQYSFFHPTFLYESILDLIGFAFLYWYRGRRETRPGDVLWLYLILYSIIRFIVEIFRIGQSVEGGLTLAQLVSIGLVVVALVGMWGTRRWDKAHGVYLNLPENDQRNAAGA